MATDVKLEQNLIAQLLAQDTAPQTCRAVASILVEDDFTDSFYAECWRLCNKMIADGIDCSIVNLHTLATSMGITLNLPKLVASDIRGDLLTMSIILHEMGVKRRLTDSLTDIVMQMDSAEYNSNDALTDIGIATEEASKTIAHQLICWQDLHEEIMANVYKKANGEIPMGVNTGYWLFDSQGGLEEGSLVIVAGRTSNGKTAFAVNLAINISLTYVPVVLYSFEMTNEQVGQRILASMAGISASNIKQAKLKSDEIDTANQVAYDIPLYLEDKCSNNKQELYASIRNAVDTKRARVVIIDYLQLLQGGEKDVRRDISKIANELKNLAKQLGITIILLSQLKREAQGSQPVPRINELKESGEIENAADAIYFVYRPEQHSPTLAYPDMSAEWSKYSTKGTALIICAKNRLGQTGEQILAFDGDAMRFEQRTVYEPAGSNNKKFSIP